NGELLPDFDSPVAEANPDEVVWPSLAWERDLLETVKHPGLPRLLDSFTQDDCEYLIEEAPVGPTLWDAWDDPDATAEKRFNYLKARAGRLRELHKAGVIIESLRPGIVTVTESGQAVLNDLTELLPFPLPPNAAIRATLYTAPEVVLSSDKADAR